jgi:flagella basal body P-ring formation protein FlgA
MTAYRQKTDVAALVLLLAAASSVPAASADIQSHASIREAVHEHALAEAATLPGRAEITVGSIDSRLKLSACDQPLQTFDSPNGLRRGRGVVGVRCDGSKPWKLFVPVRIALLEQIVISRRPMVRGQTLTAADVSLSEVDTTGLHKAYFTRVEDVIGLRTKRSVGSGKTLHAGLLRREQLVKRGAQVQIVADTGGLHVTMRGKALADGGLGDRIRVKNLNSGRVVSGTVRGRGVIEVQD